MPKIVFRGIIADEREFPTAPLPNNAVKLDMPDDIAEMQKRALPFLMPLIVVPIICMVLKTRAAGEVVVNFAFLAIGLVCGFALLFLHELLHAVAYPRGAEVIIGVIPKKLTFVALSAAPISRRRYIVSALLPTILGIAPLAAFMLTSSRILGGLLFGIAVMCLTSVYPDIYNVYNTLKKSPKGATLQNSGNDTYYYTRT